MTSPDSDDLDDGMPYQMDVYFADFPQIDPDALAKFINESDPGETDVCTVERVKVSQDGPVRLESFIAALGEFQMMILIHGVPSPAADVIHSSRLPEPAKIQLAGHKAFALLQNHGGATYAPYESLVFLYKVAVGLCAQGALGCSHLHVGIVLPRDLLLGLHGAAHNQKDDDGSPFSLWRSIREDGEPRQMLVDFGRVQALDGSDWFATRGFAFCGFPDLIYKVSTGENLEDVAAMFENGFAYLMQNGPVIQAGHTMGYDKNVAFRFENPPADLKLPFTTYAMLQVTKEVKKRKKFLGLF